MDWWKTTIARSTRTPGGGPRRGGEGSQERHSDSKDFLSFYSPDRIKQIDAGLRKNRISLLRAMLMQMVPITIRNRLNRDSMAAATFRSDQDTRTALVSAFHFIASHSSSQCAAC